MVPIDTPSTPDQPVRDAHTYLAKRNLDIALVDSKRLLILTRAQDDLRQGFTGWSCTTRDRDH